MISTEFDGRIADQRLREQRALSANVRLARDIARTSRWERRAAHAARRADQFRNRLAGMSDLSQTSIRPRIRRIANG